MLEQTLVLIKPDAMYSGWEKEITQRYLDAGFGVVLRSIFKFNHDRAAEFYAEHQGKFFFNGLVLGISCAPCGVLILNGENVIQRVRTMNGATDPSKAEVGTIRRDFLSAGGVFNAVHGSANAADAEREIDLILSWL